MYCGKVYLSYDRVMQCLIVAYRYEVGRRKVRNKKDGESSKLKYKVKKETKVTFIRQANIDNHIALMNSSSI